VFAHLTTATTHILKNPPTSCSQVHKFNWKPGTHVHVTKIRLGLGTMRSEASSINFSLPVHFVYFLRALGSVYLNDILSLRLVGVVEAWVKARDSHS